MPNAVQRPAPEITSKVAAARHGPALWRVVPDALRLSCDGNVIRIDLPDGDVRIRLYDAREGGTQIRLQATYREDEPSGRTWWSSWEKRVPASPGSSAVGTALASEVVVSRRQFARELDSARIVENQHTLAASARRRGASERREHRVPTADSGRGVSPDGEAGRW
jgi:hypothetical protein